MGETNTTRKCPACAEEVLIEAKKCKHCESKLVSRTEMRRNEIIAAAIVLSIGSCVAIVSKNPPDPDAGMTLKEWKSHRKYFEECAAAVISQQSYVDMYRLARGFHDQELAHSCSFSGCLEFSVYLKRVMRATESGNATPKDIAEMSDAAQELRRILDAAEAKIRARTTASSK